MEALLEAHAPADFLSRVEALHQGEVAILQGGVGVKRVSLEDGRDAYRVGSASSYGSGNVRFEDYSSDTHRTPPDAVRAAFRKSAQSADPESLGGTTRLMSFSGVVHDGNEVRVRDFTTDGKVIVAAPGSPTAEKVVPASSLAKPTPLGWTREDEAYPYNEPDPERRAEKVAHLNRSVIIGEAVEVGKPGTNWKQVTPENRKKVDPLVRHWMKHAHPFTACFNELAPEKGAEAAKRICAVVKDMGERSTKWRKGGKKKLAEDALVEEFVPRLLAAAGGDVELIQRYLLFEIAEAARPGSLTEEWSDASRRAAYLARIGRLHGTSVLLDHGVRVRHAGTKFHVSSPHSKEDVIDLSAPNAHETVVQKVLAHQSKATRRKPNAWMAAADESPFLAPLEEDFGDAARKAALEARKAKHPDWNWGKGDYAHARVGGLVKIKDPTPMTAPAHRVGQIRVQGGAGEMAVHPGDLTPAGKIKFVKTDTKGGSETKRFQVHVDGEHVGDVAHTDSLHHVRAATGNISIGQARHRFWHALKPGERPTTGSGHATRHEALQRLVKKKD